MNALTAHLQTRGCRHGHIALLIQCTSSSALDRLLMRCSLVLWLEPMRHADSWLVLGRANALIDALQVLCYMRVAVK
jgi:hypothetical protein